MNAGHAGPIRNHRPNVVVIVLDDVGFAQLGCFGSDVATPHIDRLAERGLRYNRFHVTALCSPTRACLLTGMNHHAVGMGLVPDFPLASAGHSGRIPRTAAMLPRLLRDGGYNTFAVGKWHLVPRGEDGGAGPFDAWPLARGFDRFYGFLRGHTNQFAPDLVADNHTVAPPKRPDDGYHLSEDLVDQAVGMILDQQHAAPGKPFFLYFAFGAMHTPFHVPPAWVEPYAGRFDDGWERWRDRAFERQVASGVVPPTASLTPRPPWVPAWSDLSRDAQRVAARMQEVFAGFMAHTDAQVGRLLAAIDEVGVLDDTIVVLLSDNGASSEGGSRGAYNSSRSMHGFTTTMADNLAHLAEFGGPRSYGLYPWGWAWAGNTPFRLWKTFTWLGGTRTPLIISWPHEVLAQSEVRGQFCHAVDLLPTLLDVTGVDRPAEVDGVPQRHLDGRSLRGTFADAAAANPRSTQYFEMLGSRSIVHEEWKATTDYVRPEGRGDLQLEGSHSLETDHWSLFRLPDDFSEAVDVSDDHPEVVRELIGLWQAEAERNDVLPIVPSFQQVTLAPQPWPLPAAITYRPGAGKVANYVLPTLSKGFRIWADVEVPDEGADGALCVMGDWISGLALYVRESHLVLAISVGGEELRLRSPHPPPSGPVRLGCSYDPPDGERAGCLTLFHGEDPVQELSLDVTLAASWQRTVGCLLIGRDEGIPVSDDYQPPFEWNGRLHRVVIETPEPMERPEALHHVLRED